MRKIAIVGKAGTSAFAPWSDESWEIWGMPWISCPRVTRLFELHAQDCVDASGCPDSEWLPQALVEYAGVPVYCDPSRLHVFPSAVEYPLDAIRKSLPVPFLENTIAYQLAMAIHEGCDVIGLFGVHMMGRDEFAWQRPSVTYLVGLAQGRGIEILIPPGSPLFISGYTAGRYGVDMGKRDISTITGWNPTPPATSQTGGHRGR